MDKNKIKKLIFGESPTALIFNLFLMLIAGFICMWIFFEGYLNVATKHGETVTVPNVDSLSLDDAEKRLASAGLRYTIFDSTPINYNPDLPYLTVLAQTPKAGEKVKDNRNIYLTVNPSQAELVKLDDILTSSLKNAAEKMKTIGVKPGKISRVEDRYQGILEVRYKGQLIQKYDRKLRKKIITDRKVHRGGKVDIVVGDGLGKSKTLVPNLVGMSEGDAEFVLFGQGLGKSNTNYIASELPPGTVVRQYPSAEEDENGNFPKIRYGRTIELWVSQFSGKK
ncbi:PASTA domain-containing protein [Flammeovirga pacifica]|uniref:PASTA domain-containing protein n=1 Tax=Flammeovirga pacifica TaxID=915059 RepID=A0A1S1YZH1_FLAPC|nr:PASTA domain-containing protein [Flammeovirga pacifica]OHX66323.1 hypothetical protein NH26_08135 [Flammeovirga pacifica]